MSKFDIISLNVGTPQQVIGEKREIVSSINKVSVLGKLWLSKENIEGNEQQDKEHHGGADKAICVYCADHYPYWENLLGTPLGSAAFGENLTVRGMTEKVVHIGDIYQLGSAIVQVTQPREPCANIAVKWNRDSIVKEMIESGFTGFYLRVLQEGEISSDDALVTYELDPNAVSIAESNKIRYSKNVSVADVKKVLAIEALSGSWRKTFERKLTS
ncbi:MOSC domain-containing protein [Longirhabdus pacifica]|uniref:MOSC domain-containing protein n=1 Tax=Longirhabdus pacifica TaxID=2305227 RepID=UPI0010088624|nr:MOSC domain-containing protein [Longirhabdus pacifica]